MTDNHPITPPPELVRHWIECCDSETLEVMIEEVARWGADQELEACCEWVGSISGKYGPRLRIARRPKPPSLAEQALKELTDWTDEKHGPGGEVFLCEGLSVIKIRRALERLQELEGK